MDVVLPAKSGRQACRHELVGNRHPILFVLFVVLVSVPRNLDRPDERYHLVVASISIGWVWVAQVRLYGSADPESGSLLAGSLGVDSSVDQHPTSVSTRLKNE